MTTSNNLHGPGRSRSARTGVVLLALAVLASCSLRDAPSGGGGRHTDREGAPPGSLEWAGEGEEGAAGPAWLVGDLAPAPYDPGKFPSPPALVAPANNVGWTPGSFAVADDGAATYSIPLQVAPGRAGIQPNLSINYNSSGGNGYLGVGMSLGGFSTITRCPSTDRDPRHARGVDLSRRDSFCLNGQLLVADDGAEYGADGTTYRTVPDTFVKVVSHGGVNGSLDYTGPRWFEVFTRDGKIQEYGRNAADPNEGGVDSTVYVGSVIHRWALSKVRDRSGNAMTYEYFAFTIVPNGDTPAHVDEQLPIKIRYTSHPDAPADRTVEFKYVGRPDLLMGFALGVPKLQRVRLDKVLAYGPSGALVREYRLDYAAGDFQKSRLESVRECTGAGECNRPTTFRWGPMWFGIRNDDLMNADDPPTNSGGGMSTFMPLDVNGDGRQDLVYPTLTGWNILFSNPDERGRYPYNAATVASAPNYGFSGVQHLWLRGLPLDYDGDGLDDLLLTDDAKHWRVLRSTGTDLVELATGLDRATVHDSQPNRRGQAAGIVLADLNGDGLKDLVEHWGNGQYASGEVACTPQQGGDPWPPCRWRYRLSTGSGFGDIKDLNVTTSVLAADAFAFDVDGDGKDELYMAEYNATKFEAFSYDESRSEGNKFVPANVGALGRRWVSAPHLFVDVNGDGLKDLLASNDAGEGDTHHQLMLSSDIGS